jgi:hypothetical protein
LMRVGGESYVSFCVYGSMFYCVPVTNVITLDSTIVIALTIVNRLIQIVLLQQRALMLGARLDESDCAVHFAQCRYANNSAHGDFTQRLGQR